MVKLGFQWVIVITPSYKWVFSWGYNPCTNLLLTNFLGLVGFGGQQLVRPVFYSKTKMEVLVSPPITNQWVSVGFISPL